jgi:hypothetical protein
MMEEKPDLVTSAGTGTSSSLLEEYRSPILVTCAYLLLYYLFIIYQVLTKYSVYFHEKQNSKKPSEVKLKDIKYFSSNTSILAADRTVGNCLEQMIPFLTSLWMYAIFISPNDASYYGMIYVCTRAYYPFVFKLGGPWLLTSTIPNYVCIGIMLVHLAQKALAL